MAIARVESRRCGLFPLPTTGRACCALQLLVSPRSTTTSPTDCYRRFGTSSPALTQRDVQWFHSQYIGDPRRTGLGRGLTAARSRLQWVAAGAHHRGRSGGLLRDDALRYAERLRAEGVAVQAEVFEVVFHGFWIAPGILRKPKRPFEWPPLG